jgi:hypothetical protein
MGAGDPDILFLYRNQLNMDHLFGSPVHAPPQSYQHLVDSPIKAKETRPYLSTLVASPIPEVAETVNDALFASPVFDLSPGQTPSQKKSQPSKRRKQPKLSNDRIQVSPSFCNDNWNEGPPTPGGVFPSPKKDFNAEDGIDWNITGDDIANLQTKIVPKYWENLQNVVHAVVRITPRLYVLQDWNRFGYLMVFKLYVFN